MRLVLSLVPASILGLALGLVDTSPNWDDSGISAGALVILCVSFGALRFAPPWASALAIGAWIPILNIAKTGNWSSMMVLPIALIAAYAGSGVRTAIRQNAAPTDALHKPK
jgi:hypothetical protein